MYYKTNLHLHSSDDPKDSIPHTFYEYINRGEKLEFQVLALTCHNRFVDRPEYHIYAKKRNMLFIPGIEKTIEKSHVVILNCNKEAEKINSFEELKQYKQNHPEIFILAPHPYFPSSYVLGKKLDQNIDIFDAIEHSWFYSKHINFNRPAEKTAVKHKLPFIATSDTHDIRFLNSGYIEVETKHITIPSLFAAIREGNFRNHAAPRKLWREMIIFIIRQEIRNLRK